VWLNRERLSKGEPRLAGHGDVLTLLQDKERPELILLG
jgi:hypothetical protein